MKPSEHKDLVEAFGLRGEIASFSPYGEGHINDTYKVVLQDAQGSRPYIFQRVNTHVFKNPDQLMENIVAVTEFLHDAIAAEGGDPLRETLNVVRTAQGKPLHRTPADEVWRVYPFIEGAISFQSAQTPRHFTAAAWAFGLFARRLGAFPAAALHETIPHFHDTPKRFRDFEEALRAADPSRVRNCRAEIDFLQDRSAQYPRLTDLLAAGELPLRVTHNDTKLNNVLIDPQSLRGVCVIDLDTVMPGLIHYDFGDAIRFGASTADEDERDLDKVHFSLPLYLAYTKGYLAAIGDALTPRERASLPWGARLMTLECGMRFLTDYLQGDLYFKIHRPGHNLDRARTQLKLVLEMEAQWQAMQIG